MQEKFSEIRKLFMLANRLTIASINHGALTLMMHFRYVNCMSMSQNCDYFMLWNFLVLQFLLTPSQPLFIQKINACLLSELIREGGLKIWAKLTPCF